MLCDVCLTSDVCLSVAYIRPKSRTERPRKTKIGTEVAHVTRDSNTTFKVKGQRSPGRFAHRRVGASGGCSGGRGNLLVVGNCCYVVVCSTAQGAPAPTGSRGAGYIVSPRAQLVKLDVAVVIKIFTEIGRKPHRKTQMKPNYTMRILLHARSAQIYKFYCLIIRVDDVDVVQRSG